MNIPQKMSLAVFALLSAVVSVQASASATFRVTPAEGLLFEETTIELTGALPGTAVTVTASLIDDDGREWSSRATYFADATGSVSSAKQASVAGTYTGIERYGLLWSMLPVPPGQHGTPKSAASEEPSFPALSTENPVDITFRAVFASELADETDAALYAEQRIFFMASGVRRTIIEGQSFEGVLFEAEGPGPRPAVMVVTGSGGGANERAAALLASRGITALAIAHFNYPGRPDELANIPLEYFYGATDWLRERAGAQRIGLMGGSRGGEAVLLLAALNPEPYAAIVSTVPSNVVWPGCCSAEASAQAAWTFRGEPISGYRYSFDTGEGFDDHDTHVVNYVRFFLGGMLDPGDAAIPVERISAPVLLLSGDSDELWPSAVAGEQILTRLEEYEFGFPVQHIIYPGAGHAATAEQLVTSLADRMVHPLSQTTVPLGGTPALNAAASRDAFLRRVAFFEQHLVEGAR